MDAAAVGQSQGGGEFSALRASTGTVEAAVALLLQSIPLMQSGSPNLAETGTLVDVYA